MDRTYGTYKSHYKLGDFHSLNLKAARSGYRAEIDDRNRTDVLIGLDALEYSALRHGGRKFLLNRRVIRRHGVRNIGGGAVLADFRDSNDVSFTETRGDPLELGVRVEGWGRRRINQCGFELSLITQSLVVPKLGDRRRRRRGRQNGLGQREMVLFEGF